MKNKNEEIFENAETFNSKRYESGNDDDSKIHPEDSAPFSLGRRNCIGQYLAKVFLKSIYSSVFSTFEIGKVDGFDPLFKIGAVYSIRDCRVRIRPL